MKKFIIIIALLWLSFNNTKAIDTNCLWEATLSGVWLNSGFADSTGLLTKVYIDTCGLEGLDLAAIETFADNHYWHNILKEEKRYYANEIFFFKFEEFPFDTSKLDMDTASYFTLNSIKDEFTDIKNYLDTIEQTTGDIRFYTGSLNRLLKNDKYLMETSFYTSFENILNAYKIEERINQNKNIKIKCEFASYFDYHHTLVKENIGKFSLFPNPAEGKIVIQTTELVNRIKITDINGNDVYNFTSNQINSLNASKEIQINISDLSAGQYFLLVDDKYFEKFVVVR